MTMIDYFKWSREYLEDAQRIQLVIEKKKSSLNDATREQRKEISREIISYRCIFNELMKTARLLLSRAGDNDFDSDEI